MSAGLLYDSVARIARHESNARSIAAVGEVTNVYPNDGASRDHAVTVKLRESGLALPRVPVAAGVLGFAAIPSVGDLVIVVFAEGDLHAPVVVGSLYRSDVTPPTHKEKQIVLRLPAGVAQPKLNCEIAGDPASIKVTLPDSVEIEITKQVIRFKADSAEATFDARGQIEIKVGDASMVLKKDGDIRLKCKDLKVQASGQIELKAAGNVKVKGATVELN